MYTHRCQDALESSWRKLGSNHIYCARWNALCRYALLLRIRFLFSLWIMWVHPVSTAKWEGHSRSECPYCETKQWPLRGESEGTYGKCITHGCASACVSRTRDCDGYGLWSVGYIQVWSSGGNVQPLLLFENIRPNLQPHLAGITVCLMLTGWTQCVFGIVWQCLAQWVRSGSSQTLTLMDHRCWYIHMISYDTPYPFQRQPSTALAVLKGPHRELSTSLTVTYKSYQYGWGVIRNNITW